MCCETELAAAPHHFPFSTGEAKLSVSELETWKPKWKSEIRNGTPNGNSLMEIEIPSGNFMEI